MAMRMLRPVLGQLVARCQRSSLALIKSPYSPWTTPIPEISAQFFATEKKYDLLLSAWTGRPDPSMTYALGFDKGAYYNAGREADPELVKLIQQSRESEDLTERAAVFAKIQRFVMENALSVPIAFQYELDALSAKVKGYKPDLLGKPKFEDIQLG